MDSTTAVAWISAAVAGWPSHAELLRELDAAAGDGDLGVTITRGSAAVLQALQDLSQDAAPADLCRAAGRAFAKGSPSTFGALVGGALLAASRAVSDRSGFDRTIAERVLDVGTATIMERGGSQVGDKTVVDALAASLQALRSAPGSPREALAAMADASRRAAQETAGLVARKGRAAWMQERTAGHVDAGAMAYTCLLDELLRSWPEEEDHDEK